MSLRCRTAPGNQLPKSSRRERFAELRQDRGIDKLLPTDRAIMMAWRFLYDAAENVEPPDASQRRAAFCSTGRQSARLGRDAF
jgi:hypothetical protein